MWEDEDEADAARTLADTLANLPETWSIPEFLRRLKIRVLCSRYGDPYARRFRIAMQRNDIAPRDVQVYGPRPRRDPPRDVPELDL
jgi:hypothetical protein